MSVDTICDDVFVFLFLRELLLAKQQQQQQEQQQEQQQQQQSVSTEPLADQQPINNGSGQNRFSDQDNVMTHWYELSIRHWFYGQDGWDAGCQKHLVLDEAV